MRVDATDWMPAGIALPGGAEEFAVGDVHGHLAQFRALLNAMAADAAPGARLTLLGDLIDRGPAGLACLRLAAAPAASLGFAGRTLLLGNHEIAMLCALADDAGAPDACALWLANGGDTTLAEAGLDARDLFRRPGHARATITGALGAEAFALVEGASLSRRVGNLVLVHAGVDPAQGIAGFLASPRLWLADEHHPAWIRQPFLLHRGGFEGGAVVVHGHTPEWRVLRMKGMVGRRGWHRLDHDRLGLDGGSYATGIVAGAAFRDGQYRVFTATGPF